MDENYLGEIICLCPDDKDHGFIVYDDILHQAISERSEENSII